MSFLRQIFCLPTELDTEEPRLRITGWTPSTPLQAGYRKAINNFDLDLSNDSSFNFSSSGTWSSGALVLGHGSSFEHTLTGSKEAGIESWPWDWFKRRAGKDGNVQIRVEARYNDEQLWKGSKISINQERDLSVNMTIETPTWQRNGNANISFYVSIAFSPSIVSLRALNLRKPPSSSLSSWSILGLSSLRAMCFDRVDIATSNAPIRFEHLEGDQVSLKTSNGSISGEVIGADVSVKTSNSSVAGSFEGCDKLDVGTLNGSITGVYQIARGSEGLRLITSNGPIHAKITVFEMDDEKKSEKLLKVDTLTSNGSVDIEFVEVPSDMKVDWKAATNNAGMTLRYPKPFDGSVKLETSNWQHVTAKIPADHKMDTRESSKNKIIANVSSGSKNSPGQVNVSATTSNGNIGFTIA